MFTSLVSPKLNKKQFILAQPNVSTHVGEFQSQFLINESSRNSIVKTVTNQKRDYWYIPAKQRIHSYTYPWESCANKILLSLSIQRTWGTLGSEFQSSTSYPRRTCLTCKGCIDSMTSHGWNLSIISMRIVWWEKPCLVRWGLVSQYRMTPLILVLSSLGKDMFGINGHFEFRYVGSLNLHQFSISGWFMSKMAVIAEFIDINLCPHSVELLWIILHQVALRIPSSAYQPP